MHFAIAFLPKLLCDIRSAEIAKTYRLTKDNRIEKISFAVPRVKVWLTTKYSNQDDLFGLDLNNINPTVNGSHNNGHSSSANDDLLMLSGANPFIQNIVNQSYSNTNPVNPFQSNGFLNNFLQFKKKFLIYV